MLAGTLKGAISQRLVKTADGAGASRPARSCG